VANETGIETDTVLLHSPSYTALRKAAFDRADHTAGDDPASILWLEQNDHLTENISDEWATDHSALRLWVNSLDGAVNTCYDRHSGPKERLSALTRRQLVDTALRQLEDESLLTDAHRYRDEIMSLFSALEAAGYDTPEALESLLRESAVPTRAQPVLEETYSRYRTLLEETVTEDEYPGFAAYENVQDLDLANLLPAVDVVVLSGYYELTQNEQQFIEQLDESFPLIVTLPAVSTPDEPGGVNAAVTDAMQFYRDIASETLEITDEAGDSLCTIASHLYTPDPLNDSPTTDEQLRWVESQTPDREVRQVAKSIKHRVATEEGFTQDNTLVVSPGLISYREHIEDTFDAHDLAPVTFVNKLLYQTNTGRAMLDLVSLCDDTDSTLDEVASLATNPAVSIDLDGAHVSKIARALPTNDLEALRDELDAGDTATIDTLLSDIDTVTGASGTATINRLRSLFETVGLDSEHDTFEGESSFDAVMERRAIRRVERALDAIERVARTANTQDTLTIVSNELDQIRVPPPIRSADGVLEIAGPREAMGQSYDHLYLLGMTAADFPPDPEQPKFFENIWDGLDDIEPTDHTAIARYQFATMLASAKSVHISTPKTTVDDDPFLESSVLDELQRVTGLEPTEQDLGHGDRESIQREVGRQTALTASQAVDRIIEAGAFTEETATHARAGVACAENRAAPDRTEHDGLIAPETVERLYPASEREPYSPSQLKDYAKCGFRFLMERVHDVDEPPEYNLEPDPLDFGSVVHDTLEYFYTGLQDQSGDAVDLASWNRDLLEERLLDAGERAVDEAAMPYDDAFYQRWLESLFAGLCTPERNSYFGARDREVHRPEEGLFAKLLTKERDRDPEAAPGWFEVQLDLSDGEAGTIEIEVGEGETVTLGGRIDRVTVDTSEDPPTGIVHDYKSSGGDLREAVDGVTFQLPIYALAAGRQLSTEDVDTPFDAGFYALDHDSLGTGWSLSYYLSREGEHEDSDERYRQLVEEVTPQRIGTAVDGIESGAFQPTVLDEGTAGCRHCAFSDVCDVRYHKRRDTIATMDDDDQAGYVPQYARPDSYLDATGGDAE
jgi:ATP-dependent helicase/nuclease subunit B